MKKGKFIIGMIFLGVVGVGLFSLVIMLLWNWLMPQIFGLTAITFWQALGLLILSKILFSGLGGAHHTHSNMKRKHWHSRFEEKWRKMSREKHDEYMRKMKEKGFGSKTE